MRWDSIKFSFSSQILKNLRLEFLAWSAHRLGWNSTIVCVFMQLKFNFPKYNLHIPFSLWFQCVNWVRSLVVPQTLVDFTHFLQSFKLFITKFLTAQHSIQIYSDEIQIYVCSFKIAASAWLLTVVTDWHRFYHLCRKFGKTSVFLCRFDKIILHWTFLT